MMKLKKLFTVSLAFTITGVLSPISQNMRGNEAVAAYSGYDILINDPDKNEPTPLEVSQTLYDDNNIKYRRNGDTLHLMECDPTASGKIVIPEVLDGTSVHAIAVRAFDNCKEITSVTIPNSVIIICEFAFSNCTSLKSISMGIGVNEIEERAFWGCCSLENVVIPNGVSELGSDAFYKCSKLKSIELSNNITTIKTNTFGECSELKSITIPPSVTKIYDEAFYRCKSLEALECGENVSYFYLSAILGCENMKYLTFKNPKCEISLEHNCETLTPRSLNIYGNITDKIVIRGYKNSTAETVAKKYGFKFSPLPSYGDPNDDGKINSVDATHILSLYAQNTVNKTKPSSDDLESCDINKDGAVNSIDASYVLSYYAYTATNKNAASLTDYMKKN